MASPDSTDFQRIFKNNRELKEFLEEAKKIVLPDKMAGITTSWLMRVSRDEVFTISREKYRHYKFPLRHCHSKMDLVKYISEEAGITLGFEGSKLPSKEWLIDCLYSIQPDHVCFRGPEKQKTIDLPAG